MNEKSICGLRFEFNNQFFESPLTYGPVRIYQVGELCCEAGYEIEQHIQSCHELTLILFGGGTFVNNGTEYHVSEGDLIFNREGETHSVKAFPHSMLRFLYFGFMFAEDGELKEFFENTSSVSVSGRKDMGITVPFLSLINEFYTSASGGPGMIEALSTQIIIQTYRLLSASEVTPFVPRRSINSVGHTVYAVLRYIDSNICNIRDIGSIAKTLGYSNTYLSHVFKQKTGMTLQRYVNYKKIESAIELMRHGTFTYTQIAEKFNFDSVQTFSKVFSRIMGCTPSEFERRIAAGKVRKGG
jgi:AraC-like DNA-binding protein/quercetin dioxygenase-like cupin family protein